MAEQRFTHENLKLHGIHVPEPEGSFDAGSHDVLRPVTGIYQIVAEVEGALVPIFAEKASKVFALIERAHVASPVEPGPGEQVPAALAAATQEKSEKPADTEDAGRAADEPTERERQLQEDIDRLTRERDAQQQQGQPPPPQPPPST